MSSREEQMDGREGFVTNEDGSITEGIGQGRITANLEGFKPDYSS